MLCHIHLHLFNISHGHAVSLFLKISLNLIENLSKSESKFNLKKRYELIFKIFNIQNIDQFSKKNFFILKKKLILKVFKNLNIDLKSHTFGENNKWYQFFTIKK